MKRSIYAIFGILLLSSTAYADEQTQGWFNTSLNWNITDEWVGNFATSTRSTDEFEDIGTVQVGVDLGYKLNDKWTIYQGFVWDGSSFNTERKDEFRPYQQVVYKQKFGDWTLALRTKLEERIFDYHNNDLSMRFRQQVRGEYALNDKWYLAASEEVFVNINNVEGLRNKAGVDQNRVFGGVGYNLTEQAKVEVGYLYRWVHGFDVTEDVDQHILYTGFNYSF